MVPKNRIQMANDAQIRENGQFVLYWMVSARRTRYNFALDRAVEWAKKLNKPLLVFEAVNADYRWNSARFHSFILNGMNDNSAACSKAGVRYYPYVEPKAGAGKGLLKALSALAAIVITDDFPCFFIDPMISKTALKLDVCVEKIDSNGIYPIRDSERIFPSAYVFRRHLQKQLPEYLDIAPRKNALSAMSAFPKARLPKTLQQAWPAASQALLRGEASALAGLPIHHEVSVVATKGGAKAAQKNLKSFVSSIGDYELQRNKPEQRATSFLSPYLHFGHISAHEVVLNILRTEDWSFDCLLPIATGQSAGWWGTGKSAEQFLDQIITWRELGYNFCANSSEYDQFESLPVWAQDSLELHQKDYREYEYSLADFENAQTHDPLWNAAQRQLLQDGIIHNYLRMLWGKKILHWTKSPRLALDIMIELNNKYALDGRNPNSYSGIFWVLGRYDRAWGPERSIFGKIRYMTSENTARKHRVKDYIQNYS